MSELSRIQRKPAIVAAGAIEKNSPAEATP
jgi:hypothetical protein